MIYQKYITHIKTTCNSFLMLESKNTNVRTQKFLTMKDFNNACLKTRIRTIYMVILMILSINGLWAQVSVTIDTPADGSSYCAELGETVNFTATGMDGGQAIADANINWEWSGPNGFSSMVPNPSLLLDNTQYTGEYIVKATFTSNEVAYDTIELTVDALFDWSCPGTVFVTPDLNDPMCAKNYTFGGFDLDAVNCTNLAYTWQAVFETEGGMIINPDPGSLPGSYTIDNTLFNQTYASGLYFSDLPFGFHELRINLISGGIIYDQCIIDVNVVESRGNLACNDLVNITMDGDCEANITPEMILVREHCFDLFGLNVENTNTGTVANGTGSVMIFEPGLYNVTVTGQTGISCWGQILAEDKSAPILDCEDIEMYCSTLGTAPGDEIRGFDRGWVLDETVGAGSSETYNLILNDINGVIQDVILNFHAEMPDVSELELYLTSPEGTTRQLLDLNNFSQPCGNANINVCLTDAASNLYAMFGSPDQCRSTQNALIGSFRPSQTFSGFDGQSANHSGNWTWQLEVINNSGSAVINIIEADLQVYTREAYLLSSSDIIESNGCSDDQSHSYEDEQLGANCEQGYWQHIIRTWRVTNSASGLTSTCEQNIFLKQWTINEVIWPKSYDDLDQPALRCTDISSGDLNANNVPTPDRTGRPRVPFGDLCGNFQVTHSDLTFDICGDISKKTVRTWSILDWCTGEIEQYDQTIKLIDDEPILITCVPDNITSTIADEIGYDISEEAYVISSNPYTCDGNWTIVYPSLIDNACDDNVTIEVYYLLDDDEDPDDAPVDGVYTQENVYDENGRQINSVQSNGVAYEIRNLPVNRRTWIKMVATDECGNTGECFTEVDVVDRTRPIPVCIEYTVAAFGETGVAKVHAESLDNGSWDNCGVVDYEVKKSTDPNSRYTDTYEFFCNCNNPDMMMHLKVTDAAGNTNTCLVEVRLQDNLPPQRTSAPQSLYTFDCSESPVDISSIIDQSVTEFEYIDNCFNANNQNPVLNINVSVVNEAAARADFETTGCGDGNRYVRYEIRDQCNEILGSFVQTFRFTNSSINNPSTFNVTRWPSDYDVTNCSTVDGLEPMNLPSLYNADNIVVNTSVCNDIAIGWDDAIFADVQDACFKILRTWTVIDWCIADRTSIEQGTRAHTQVIKVFDNQPPNIIAPNSVVIESKSQTCFTAVDTSALVIDVTDDCTDMFIDQDITYYYYITYPDGSRSSNRFNLDANESYPFGESIITWYAEDHCGNFSERTTRVIVNDAKKPTPYCLGSVVTATMNTNGSAEIWAKDFDLGGTDNYTGNTACGNFNQLDIYFLDENNNKVDALFFDCDDILNGISQVIPLNVYYEDEYGNVDFCVVRLELQDNAADLCEDTEGSMIAGSVHTENEEMLENVAVTIQNYIVEFSDMRMTDESGYYAFSDIPTSTDYAIRSTMEDDPLNGVSTLDLVLIQRHILGLQELGTPFKLIAADADNSGNVSVIDLLTIRKLILGVTMDFPNGQQAWRFPDEGQVFLDPRSPFPYSEEIDIFNLHGDMLNQDFVAVKIGDVNASADLTLQGIIRAIEKRSPYVLSLMADDQRLFKGEQVTVPVYSSDLDDILGFQATINFNKDRMSFAGVKAGQLDVTEDNIGLNYLESGIITLSWNSIVTGDTEEDLPLFEFVFDMKEDALLSNELYINSSLTEAEAYDSELRVMDLELEFRGEERESFVLYQNTPNPFLETTDVSFKLPKASNVQFTVFDVTGRILMQERDYLDAGIHTITLYRDQLRSMGVMYYKVETDYGSDSRKMIQIR